jgi:hypothetical protein
VIDFRRALLLLTLATAGCEIGPTSEWPRGESSGDDLASGKDAGAAALDAATTGDAGTASTSECDAAVNAGDAGADAACAVDDQ